nr:retrotransposon protein [Tanacetum cinerariifolium]
MKIKESLNVTIDETPPPSKTSPLVDDDFDEEEAIKICHGVDLEPNEWIKDSRCSKHMTGNQKLFSTYKAYNGGNVIFGSNLRGNIIGKGYSQNSKAYIILNKHTMKIKESLNVTIDETPPPSKTSPLVDDDFDEEEAIKGFGENVSDIVDERDFFDRDMSFLDIVSKKVVTNFDVFSPRVLHRVLSKVNRAFIVAHDWGVVESNVIVDESLFHP